MDTKRLTEDFWGGFGAMLVALPSAIAFGVTILSPLGPQYAAEGAIAGILGCTALGLVAPVFGGTHRLITAPCAPAAAILSAFAIESTSQGIPPENALLMLTFIGLICGLVQLLFGVVGLGRLIKYMPYPVVSGYMSGVGIIIIVSQIPKFLGVGEPGMFHALASPPAWVWQGMVVGAVTIAVMVVAPRFTRIIPASILGLAAGMVVYFGLGLAVDDSMLNISDNPLIVGQLATGEGGFFDTITGRFAGIGSLDIGFFMHLLVPALTLAVLLCIDTLKTCVVLDALTRTRHQSNRELRGQGLANIAAGLIGGVNGAGTMGPTLVNFSSGGQTRLSSLIEGVMSLVAFLVLSKVIAWVPIASLAGILLVIGVRMIDWSSLAFLRQRSTILDFAVILTVVIVAQTVGLIEASGSGILLAIALFIREQIGGTVVRRKIIGNQISSKQMRVPEEMEILDQNGERTAILELQGSLFFGTTDQFYNAIEPELKKRDFVILDMARIQSVDITAAHLLEQMHDMLADRGATLIFSQLPRYVPTGQDMEQYFDAVGLVHAESSARTFDDLDQALEWVEDRIIDEAQLHRTDEAALDLRDIELFSGRRKDTIRELRSVIESLEFVEGEKIFSRGDHGDEIFLIRSGKVRILLPISEEQNFHIATFGRGNFFGEMAFLDRQERSADAVADSDVKLYALSRSKFDDFADDHRKVAIEFMESIARLLSIRLRHADAELRATRDIPQ